MQDGLAEKQVQQRGDVGLYDKEEELFGRNLKECRANDGIGRIAPDPGADQVGIPGCGGDDGDLEGISIGLSLRVLTEAYADEKQNFIDIESCTEGAVAPAQGQGWGDRVQ